MHADAGGLLFGRRDRPQPGDLGAHLALLDRGQGWVVRKLQALRCCAQQQAVDAAAGGPTPR